MATIIEALETLAAKGWWKEWQNPAWKLFILTGDEKQLKRIGKAENRKPTPEVKGAGTMRRHTGDSPETRRRHTGDQNDE